MPHLVGDDVRLRELTPRAELAGELVEEAEVQIDLLVGGAVEGGGRRTALAASPAPPASRAFLVGVEDELRVTVGASALREDATPGVLDVVEDEPDEVHFGRVGIDPRARAARRSMKRTRVACIERAEPSQHDVAGTAEDQDDPSPRAAEEPEHEKEEAGSPSVPGRTLAASINDVGAFVRVVPAHSGKPLSLRGHPTCS